MHKLLLVTALGLVSGVCAVQASTHKLATLNNRVYAVEDTEGKDWQRRGPFTSELVKKYDFDVIGFQELSAEGKGYYNPKTGRTPMADLKAWLGDYTFVAWDRDGDINREYVAVAYKTTRYTMVDEGSFYVSPTPDEFSLGWDRQVNKYPRRLGWVRLKEKATGEEMVFASTHTNSGYTLDGVYGSQLIAERLLQIAGGLPVMVVADFNTNRTGEVQQRGLKAYHANFYDAALECPEETNYSVPTSNPAATWTYQAYHPVTDTSYKGTELDYHFYRGMNVLERHIVTEEFSYGGNQYPSSDHFPVYVVAELNPTGPTAYHVDSSAGDGGDGSELKPYNKIGDAVNAARLGDVVKVASGIYNESLEIKYTITIEGGYSSDFSSKEGETVIEGTGLMTPPIHTDNTDYAFGRHYASLTLRDLTISGYTSSVAENDGALQFNGCDLTIERCEFNGNKASSAGFGGAIAIYNPASGNYVQANNVTLKDCVFTGNKARNGGGAAMAAYGDLRIEGCGFDNNTASYNGAALYLHNGKTVDTRIWFTNAKYLIKDCSFTDNKASRSSAVYFDSKMYNTKAAVVNTTFAGNSISCNSTSETVLAASNGTAMKAIYTETTSAFTQDGVVKNPEVTLAHVTAVGNHAASSNTDGTFNASSLNFENVCGTIVNSIIAANSTTSANGHADVSANSSLSERNNFFTSASTVNFIPDESSVKGENVSEGIKSLAGLFEGTVEEGIFTAQFKECGKNPTKYVPLKGCAFGGKDINSITPDKREIEKLTGFDIDGNGKIDGILATDQIGNARANASMPGAIEWIDPATIPFTAKEDNGVSVKFAANKYVEITAASPIGRISITGLDGRKVLETESSSTSCIIDISSLQNGVYIATCLDNSCKFIK